jgi:hypothetical protein
MVVGNLAVDGGQELLELDGEGAGVQGADDLARGHVQGGVETRGAVPLIIVTGTLRRAGQRRQDRGGAIQRLDVGLLVTQSTTARSGGAR